MTIKDIIETAIKNDSYRNRSINDVIHTTGKVVKLLLRAELNEELAEETKIFITCKNSTKHITNLLNNYTHRDDDTHQTLEFFIDKELDKIMEEDYLMHQEERIKSELLTRTSKLHDHMNHIQDVFIKYNTGAFSDHDVQGSDLSSILINEIKKLEATIENSVRKKVINELRESEKRMAEFFLNIIEEQNEKAENRVEKVVKLMSKKSKA